MANKAKVAAAIGRAKQRSVAFLVVHIVACVALQLAGAIENVRDGIGGTDGTGVSVQAVRLGVDDPNRVVGSQVVSLANLEGRSDGRGRADG